MYSVIAYQAAYANSVSQIFHEAIHAIDDECYSAENKAAWSAKPRSSYHWHKRLLHSKSWIVVDRNQIVEGKPKCCGFINLETTYHSRGYIDSLYVHPEHQGKGLARKLYEVLELWAREQGYSELSVDASLLSKGVFLSYGFKQHHRSYQEKLGQVIMGFLMSKPL
ncbi:Acetyltransferase, GNAT family [Shewanella psychrophila]|uniref:Acetyltransferase, GNAT family n=1 Tax=Shewanella psychrophila TaxID=225848 RepID=A0A1S6HU65_9GAMM|nr:GNAT family N-acetyltransferase [Shewanella psychrophila]AQS38958.1 Acetyltransferase, GNAT family [Shewanella psychrophila]